MNWRAVSCFSSAVNGSTSTRSMAVLESSSSFSSNGVSTGSQRRVWSKVMTSDSSPRSLAQAATCCSTNWCPRCTPSNIPIVATYPIFLISYFLLLTSYFLLLTSYFSPLINLSSLWEGLGVGYHPPYLSYPQYWRRHSQHPKPRLPRQGNCAEHLSTEGNDEPLSDEHQCQHQQESATCP